MYLYRILFSFVFGWVTAANDCTYKNLMEHLGLVDDNFQMKSLRPVHNWSTPTYVYLDMFVTSIPDVNEKAQSLSTQVTFQVGWTNEFTRWNSSDFCGINMSSVEKDKVWIPDITIAESIKTEYAATENPYVKLVSLGFVVMIETLALTTACKMDLMKFPFDIQTCSLTFQSPVHSITELTIYPFSNAVILTSSSKKAFQTQGEWEFLNINMSKSNMSTVGTVQDQLIYTITMKRRPLLYVITFISPVFCFLVLDVVSFFIDAGGGEKLSFKVTLLLAISVLLLILKDTLPSTASNVPWIGVYCSAIFILIGIGILETILVNFLMAKGDQISSEEPVNSTSAVTDPVKDLSDPAAQNKEHSCVLERMKQILMESRTAADQNRGEGTCLSWTRVARIIHMTFMILYITSIIVFLVIIYKAWFID